MTDLTYQKPKNKSIEPEEYAICIFGVLIVVANIITFLAVL